MFSRLCIRRGTYNKVFIVESIVSFLCVFLCADNHQYG